MSCGHGWRGSRRGSTSGENADASTIRAHGCRSCSCGWSQRRPRPNPWAHSAGNSSPSATWSPERGAARGDLHRGRLRRPVRRSAACAAGGARYAESRRHDRFWDERRHRARRARRPNRGPDLAGHARRTVDRQRRQQRHVRLRREHGRKPATGSAPSGRRRDHHPGDVCTAHRRRVPGSRRAQRRRHPGVGRRHPDDVVPEQGRLPCGDRDWHSVGRRQRRHPQRGDGPRRGRRRWQRGAGLRHDGDRGQQYRPGRADHRQRRQQHRDGVLDDGQRTRQHGDGPHDHRKRRSRQHGDGRPDDGQRRLQHRDGLPDDGQRRLQHGDGLPG